MTRSSNIPLTKVEKELFDTMLASWEHISTHAIYKPGEGYMSLEGMTPCSDPAEHKRLIIAEGEAWHRLQEEHKKEKIKT